MENFVAYNGTKLHFGKGVVADLGKEAAAFGKKALIIYGGGSVKTNGSYHDTMEQLSKNGIDTVEYSGIKPNPLVGDVDKAAEIGRKESVDLVVAIGGGSAIDSAKIISVCIADNVPGWDIMSRKHEPQKSIPLISVLTLAATGTEMNPTAVLQNPDTDEKIGFRHPVMYAKHSFLDPNYTRTVPGNYTAFGIVDLIAHSLEAWFGIGTAPLSDRFVVGIIKEAMEVGPELMTDLNNYEYRERILWASTCALNDTTLHGRKSGDFGVHSLGHVLSYLYDTPHGATLSMIYPAWMRRIGEKDPERVIELGKALFNVDSVESTVQHIQDFFTSVGSPVNAFEAGYPKERKEEILSLMTRNNSSGIHYLLNDEDRELILSAIF